MGERKCAFEGCNALEFRTSGYCLRHKGGIPKVEEGSDNSEYTLHANSGSRSHSQSDSDWWVLKEEESELQPEGSNGEEAISESSDHVDFFDNFYVVMGVIGTVYLIWFFSTGQWVPCISIGQDPC